MDGVDIIPFDRWYIWANGEHLQHNGCHDRLENNYHSHIHRVRGNAYRRPKMTGRGQRCLPRICENCQCRPAGPHDRPNPLYHIRADTDNRLVHQLLPAHLPGSCSTGSSTTAYYRNSGILAGLLLCMLRSSNICSPVDHTGIHSF